MSEKLRLDTNDRIPYAPTPLSPWELVNIGTDGEETAYYQRSLRKFDELTDLHRMEQPEWLVDAVYTALMHLHASRCDRNYAAYSEHLSQTADAQLPQSAADLIYRAKVGTADIRELLQLHEMGLGLPSVGLAKQSHPFSWDTTAMDTAMNMAIDAHDPKVQWLDRGADRRYTFYRAVPEGAAQAQGLVIVRKRNVANVHNANTVVKRSTFILRLDGELPVAFGGIQKMFSRPDTSRQEQYSLQSEIINKLLANGQEQKAIEFMARTQDGQFLPGYHDAVSKRLAENSGAIEEGIHDHAEWLVPTATSYYVRTARYIPPKNQSGPNDQPKQYFSEAG